MKNRKWEIRSVLIAATFVVLLGGSQTASAGSVYDAVADFSIASNPNGTWSYLYNPGSGVRLITHPVVNYAAPGVNAWWDGLTGPQALVTLKNTTKSTIDLYGTVPLTPNVLCMDPVNNPSDITRWTAPSAGAWSISGFFQAIDIYAKSHTVEILENSTTSLLALTTLSSYGQTVNFTRRRDSGEGRHGRFHR